MDEFLSTTELKNMSGVISESNVCSVNVIGSECANQYLDAGYKLVQVGETKVTLKDKIKIAFYYKLEKSNQCITDLQQKTISSLILFEQEKSTDISTSVSEIVEVLDNGPQTEYKNDEWVELYRIAINGKTKFSFGKKS